MGTKGGPEDDALEAAKVTNRWASTLAFSELVAIDNVGIEASIAACEGEKSCTASRSWYGSS